MPSVTRSVKASVERWELWKRAAVVRGLTVNGWVCKSLDEAAEADLVDARFREELREERERLIARAAGVFE